MSEEIIKKLICIECPRGCGLSAALSGGAVISVNGQFCAKGKRYAENECVKPVRVLTTTVRMTDGGMLPVKTSRAIDKDKLLEIMGTVNRVTVSPPVFIGQVLLKNIDGGGADLVAAKDVRAPQ